MIFLKYLLYGFIIFFFVITWLYICDRLNVSYRHGDKEETSEEQVYFDNRQTVRSLSPLTYYNAQNSFTGSLSIVPNLNSLPQELTIADLHEPSNSRYQEEDTCDPPPTYKEAIEMI